MLEAAGCTRVVTMDLHDPQFQGYFSVPVDNLFSAPLIIKYIKEKIQYKNSVVVSPDAGGAKRFDKY
jgi:ribose-phosphate pyrophosphokinase